MNAGYLTSRFITPLTHRGRGVVVVEVSPLVVVALVAVVGAAA